MNHLADQPGMEQSTNTGRKKIWIVATTNIPQRGQKVLPNLESVLQIWHNGWQVKVTDQPQSSSAYAGPSIDVVGCTCVWPGRKYRWIWSP